MTNEKAFEKFILSDDWQEIRLHAQNSDELAENVWQAAIAYMQEQNKSTEQSEPVAYLCRSKMTDYAISLLPTKVARERESAKGWSDWHPVEVEKYKFYLNSIGKSDWLSCYEFIPLFTTPQRQQPLKRLSDDAIGECLNKAELPTIMLHPIVTEKLGNFANAIMDEMERINK